METDTTNKGEIKVTTSRCLLEIFVYGIEEDKPVIKKLFDNIQQQMAKTKKGNKARILWYIDKGELSIEDKKKWLIENSNSKYYIFCESRTIKPTYVKDLLMKIKKIEKTIEDFKASGIIVSKRKPEEVKVEAEQNNLQVVK